MTNLFRVSGDDLLPVERLELNVAEKQLEEWIKKDPRGFGLEVLVIGQQVRTEHGKFIDLVGIDSEGALTIIELKRALTPREVVAQVLDYASWVRGLKTEYINEMAARCLNDSLSVAFKSRFDEPLPEELNGSHKMVIVAGTFDDSSRRIVEYLSDQYGVPINTLLFNVFQHNGETWLATDWLVDQEELEEKVRKKDYPMREADLVRIADERKVGALLELCRHVGEQWKEDPGRTYGGSFVYWAQAPEGAQKGGRTVHQRIAFGINVSGQKWDAPAGELDVWIPTGNLAEATEIDEPTIRSTLTKIGPPLPFTGEKLWLRLRTPAQAEDLVQQLRTWALASQSSSASV